MNSPNKVEIGEDESLLQVESTCNDVLRVGVRERSHLLGFQCRFEEELLIIYALIQQLFQSSLNLRLVPVSWTTNGTSNTS